MLETARFLPIFQSKVQMYYRPFETFVVVHGRLFLKKTSLLASNTKLRTAPAEFAIKTTRLFSHYETLVAYSTLVFFLMQSSPKEPVDFQLKSYKSQQEESVHGRVNTMKSSLQKLEVQVGAPELALARARAPGRRGPGKS